MGGAGVATGEAGLELPGDDMPPGLGIPAPASNPLSDIGLLMDPDGIGMGGRVVLDTSAMGSGSSKSPPPPPPESPKSPPMLAPKPSSIIGASKVRDFCLVLGPALMEGSSSLNKLASRAVIEESIYIQKYLVKMKE